MTCGIGKLKPMPPLGSLTNSLPRPRRISARARPPPSREITGLPEFWEGFEQLPPKIQTTARKNYTLWLQQPGLKSLAFKKIKGDLWSIRAGSGCRALGTFIDGAYVWFWIGPHDEYERLIRAP